jgi:hypothetical protein
MHGPFVLLLAHLGRDPGIPVSTTGLMVPHMTQVMVASAISGTCRG